MKRKIYYSLAILLVLTVALLFNSKKEYIIYNDNIKIALNVNGNTTNVVPPRGQYKVSVNCGSTGDGSWDYDKWELKVANAKSEVKCDLTFTGLNINEQKFNDYIISQAQIMTSDYDLKKGGIVVEEHGLDTTTEYRYEGKFPNNYVWFNNELWRIIGVFDEGSHGIVGKNLVKIMRAESIGGISWDARGTSGSTYDSNWGIASLNTLLNDFYYKQRNTNDSGEDVSKYCHMLDLSTLGSCDYSTIGLSESYRNMVVENAKWYLKGETAGNNAKKLYDSERNGSKKSESFLDYVEKPVGLMYASDYGYSAGIGCIAKILTGLDSNICASGSWIYGQGDEWTISHYSSSSDNYAWYINAGGYIDNRRSYTGNAVRPSVYLRENTYIIGGEGTQKNPYIIGYAE